MIRRILKKRKPAALKSEPINIPQHIGIILDGNRRWARSRRLSISRGHSAGLKRVEGVVRTAVEAGVKFVSLFVFSVDNWKRSTSEVNHLMKLAVNFIAKEGDRLVKEGVRIQFAGRIDQTLNPEVRESIKRIEKQSAKNKKATIVLCFNYGGHVELVDMVKKIIRRKVSPKMIDLEFIRQHLYLPNVPDLDLIIRTSGEQRISGFQLYRASYAEILFVNKHWPDFGKQDLLKALAMYQKRGRRFGG